VRVCTVVVRWEPGRPLWLAAVRDERTARPFDDPDAWWPDRPDVIGGRDRVAGGSWCVSDVSAGTSALVLNRPQRPVAEPGAASRGVLPLLALEHGARWPAHVERAGMASFALLLATPAALTLWTYDGTSLSEDELPSGTHMVTSGGGEDGKAARYLAGFTAGRSTDDWRALFLGHRPQDDPAALVVRHETSEWVYATVFAQVFSSAPGTLRLTYSRTPWLDGTWTSTTRTASPR